MKHKSLLLAAIIPLLFAGCGSSEESYIDREVRTFTAEPFEYEHKDGLEHVFAITLYTPITLTCTNEKDINYKGYYYSYKEKTRISEYLHTVFGTFEFGDNNTFLFLSGTDGVKIGYKLQNGVWVRRQQGGPYGDSKPYPPAFYEVKTENK